MPAPIRVHSLSEEEIAELESLRKQTKDADLRSRCEMILHSNNGLSTLQIEQFVPFSHDTVLRVIRAYEDQGIQGLYKGKSPGRPRTVTDTWLQELQTAVSQSPRSLGLPFSNWSCGRLATYLAQKTGIEVSEDTVERYLKRFDWRLLRPVPSVAHKQDPEAVQEKKTRLTT